ncbi:MAG: AI-2E family transporter [Ignavibacteria bacterium]|jgi:predicted PurR-regulated permease PerM|nr:AI-2E family transporter [Ignavibacteria bacterium]
MSARLENNSVYDIVIRMLVLLLIVAWCLMLLYPFVSIMLWGMILALAFAPIHRSFTNLLRGNAKIASVMLVIISIAVILIPSYFFLETTIKEVKDFSADFKGGTLSIPPPSESVKSWPVVGEVVYQTWYTASTDIKVIIIKYQDQLLVAGKKIAGGILGAVGGVFQMMISLIIAGVLLAYGHVGESIRKFFRKLVGERGDEFADIAGKTIGNVVKGILGVAFIQALLIGGGMLMAGIPYAGILSLVVFILAVLQLPPAIVMIPVIIYLFSVNDFVPAILWTLYFVLAGLSDNVLKPILLGKGAPVPMLVIFIGVIGGFILQGFIGLFTGAIIMSIGYKLFVAWINSAPQNTPPEETAAPVSAQTENK